MVQPLCKFYRYQFVRMQSRYKCNLTNKKNFIGKQFICKRFTINLPINGHVDKALDTWIVEHFFLYWVRIKNGVESEFSTLSFAIDLFVKECNYKYMHFKTKPIETKVNTIKLDRSHEIISLSPWDFSNSFIGLILTITLTRSFSLNASFGSW